MESEEPSVHLSIQPSFQSSSPIVIILTNTKYERKKRKKKPLWAI